MQTSLLCLGQIRTIFHPISILYEINGNICSWLWSTSKRHKRGSFSMFGEWFWKFVQVLLTMYRGVSDLQREVPRPHCVNSIRDGVPLLIHAFKTLVLWHIYPRLLHVREEYPTSLKFATFVLPGGSSLTHVKNGNLFSILPFNPRLLFRSDLETALTVSPASCFPKKIIIKIDVHKHTYIHTHR